MNTRTHNVGKFPCVIQLRTRSKFVRQYESSVACAHYTCIVLAANLFIKRRWFNAERARAWANHQLDIFPFVAATKIVGKKRIIQGGQNILCTLCRINSLQNCDYMSAGDACAIYTRACVFQSIRLSSTISRESLATITSNNSRRKDSLIFTSSFLPFSNYPRYAGSLQTELLSTHWTEHPEY